MIESRHTPELRAGRAQLLQVGDGVVVAEIGLVCLAVWRKKPSPQRFEIQRAALKAVADRHSGKAAFLCVVEAGTEPPDDDIRKASSAMISSMGGRLTAIAIVVEGSGFKAAISRTVLSGIGLLVRTPAPIRYFESASSAGAWLSEYVPIGNVPQFVHEVELVRGSLASV